MATIASQGFVIQSNPPQPIVCFVARLRTSQSTDARLTETQPATAVWRHDCEVDTMSKPYLIKRETLSIPQRNDRRFLITIRDQDGNLEDVSGANEITFIIGRTVKVAPDITKTKTGGGIVLTTNSQLQIDISDVESEGLTLGNNYYEILVESSSGDKQTVLAGPFIVEDTRIGD